MANLLNYLPCPKCKTCSSNLIQMEMEEMENDLFLKLLCTKNCSTNCISFSELKQLLNGQTKIPLSILIHGKFSKDQEQIENISTKIYNIYDSIISDIENMEKEITKMKEEIKNEIIRYKKNFEDFQLLHELIYGAYLKNIKDDIEQDNELILNDNLKLLNIYSNTNIMDNFYIKEIQKDIVNMRSLIVSIKKEVILYFKYNKIISINENNNNKSILPLVNLNTRNSNIKHTKISTFNTNLKNIENILQLSDGNILLGSDEQMIVYNLEINKEILNIPGDFSDVRELKYNKKYKNKNVIVLSVCNKSIKIYDIYNKTLLLNYSQYYTIDNVLELYNGDILYICDYSIFNMSLKEEFKINLKDFCFSMINLFDKQDIFGYTNLSKIKFIYLNNPKKVFKELLIKDSQEIFDLKQIYEENNNINYLIILSSIYIDLYDFETDEFKITIVLNMVNLYKKINISKDDKNTCLNLISSNSVKSFQLKKDKLIEVHTIESLKPKNTPLYCKIKTTPFCVNKDGKYLLIFESNDQGFNSF